MKITSLFSKNKTNFSLTNTHILLFLCKIPLFYTAHLFPNYYSISNLHHIGMSSNFLSDSYLKLIYSSIIIQFLMSLTLGWAAIFFSVWVIHNLYNEINLNYLFHSIILQAVVLQKGNKWSHLLGLGGKPKEKCASTGTGILFLFHWCVTYFYKVVMLKI